MAQLDDDALRRVALAAAAEAVRSVELEDPLIAEALAAAESQTFGDDALIKRLRDLADDIEDPYLSALDRDVVDEAMLVLFRQARAVTALYLALDDDIHAQAANAVYEALHAGVEAGILRQYVADVRE